jgi:acetylornithine/succinyldiaminopimelate/putrescine aminotransferase
LLSCAFDKTYRFKLFCVDALEKQQSLKEPEYCRDSMEPIQGWNGSIVTRMITYQLRKLCDKRIFLIVVKFHATGKDWQDVVNDHYAVIPDVMGKGSNGFLTAFAVGSHTEVRIKFRFHSYGGNPMLQLPVWLH